MPAFFAARNAASFCRSTSSSSSSVETSSPAFLRFSISAFCEPYDVSAKKISSSSREMASLRAASFSLAASAIAGSSGAGAGASSGRSGCGPGSRPSSSSRRLFNSSRRGWSVFSSNLFHNQFSFFDSMSAMALSTPATSVGMSPPGPAPALPPSPSILAPLIMTVWASTSILSERCFTSALLGLPAFLADSSARLTSSVALAAAASLLMPSAMYFCVNFGTISGSLTRSPPSVLSNSSHEPFCKPPYTARAFSFVALSTLSPPIRVSSFFLPLSVRSVVASCRAFVCSSLRSSFNKRVAA